MSEFDQGSTVYARHYGEWVVGFVLEAEPERVKIRIRQDVGWGQTTKWFKREDVKEKP